MPEPLDVDKVSFKIHALEEIIRVNKIDAEEEVNIVIDGIEKRFKQIRAELIVLAIVLISPFIVHDITRQFL